MVENLEILYEDPDILAINKPSGLVVHSDGRTQEPSVSEWFVEKYPDAQDVGEKMGEVERPGIVHRIDRETSGVLLLAKTERGHALLKKQFQNHEVEKVYHTFLSGVLKDDSGQVNLKIDRSKSDFRKRIAGREGREALTYYRVLARGEGFTFVEARPKTGRTHQIRVHFKALHCPVIGDKLYAPSTESALGFRRLALHAKSIEFTNTEGKRVVVEAPYPPDFQAVVDKLG